MKNEWNRLVWFNSSEMNFKEITWLVYTLLYVKIVGIFSLLQRAVVFNWYQ